MERFPGDKSHRPLAQLTAENKAAHRAPHLRKKHHVAPDTVDALDTVGGGYHHQGPFDATLFARNNSARVSPIVAVTGSNAEALRATPREKVMDSVQGHRPLDGVAAYPPGAADRNGHVYKYQEGENMMVEGAPEGGAYRRWPGVQYLPEDVKGKGEPSYSVEKALKEHNASGPGKQTSGDIEMTSRPRSSRTGARRSPELYRHNSVGATDPSSHNTGWGDSEPGVSRTGGSRRLSGGIKRRIGSIRKQFTHDKFSDP